MTRNDCRLVACLEDVMFRMPRDARDVVPLSIAGVRGRRTPLPTPYTNLVGVAGPGVEPGDASITEVFEEFRSHRATFGWLVGPHSPSGLAARLAARGMVKEEEFAGLALRDLARPVPVPEGVSVREVGREERGAFAELLSRAFGMPEAMVSFMCETLFFAGTEPRARNYVAHVEGVSEPVAAASTLYDPTAPLAVLAGSAVLEEQRGRGVYRALVARRLADLRREGIEAVVIQAVRSSSAPICRSLGFEEVCAQQLYAWSPG